MLRRSASLFLVLELAAACGAARELDDVHDPSDDAALAKCRNEGRGAKDAGASPRDAFDTYVRCRKDAGLQ
jgi:hypothetical protein